MHPSVVRWVERTLRSHWPFDATPLRLVFKADPPRRRRRNALARAEGASSRFVKMPKKKWRELQKPFWQREKFVAQVRERNRERRRASQEARRAAAAAGGLPASGRIGSALAARHVRGEGHGQG